MYSPDATFPVYCNACFYSDKWDAGSYEMEIDWSRPFMEQWFELWNKTPKFAQIVFGNVKNSDFSNSIINSTGCYLSYSVTESEDILYSENIDKSTSMIDCYMSIEGCDSCYYSQGRANYNCKYTSQCANSIDCNFCFDCRNCQDCFMSYNLRNKKYVFRGMQLTKEDYKIAIEKEKLPSRESQQGLYKEWKNMIVNDAVHQYGRIVNGSNVTGNFIRSAKELKSCFNIYNSENIAYGARVLNAKDSYDVYDFADGELVYETVACSFGSNRNIASINSVGCRSLYYSTHCNDSSDMFGCHSMRKKSNCILNKQYSKEEYETLFPRLVEHMNIMPYIDKKGRVYRYSDFIPYEFSPFGYNETLNHDFFRLTKEEAISRGYNWFDAKEKNYTVSLNGEDVPDTISQTDDSITNEVIACVHAENNESDCNHQCTKAFKIIAEELYMYRKMDIPIPIMCPNCRHYERLPVFIQPFELWHRQCMCDKEDHDHSGICPVEFETSFAPDRPEIVYCESCYQKEVL